MNKTIGKERRQAERFKVKDTVFLTFRPQFDRLGRLKDISKSGVAFEYTAYEDYEPLKDVEIDIFSHARDFHVPRISCKVVYDIRIDTNPNFSGVQNRRCGLQFHELSQQQLSHLDVLFKAYLQSHSSQPH